MLVFFGVLFIIAGLLALTAATTMFGQIAGLVLWVIAALFLVGHAVVRAIEREARGLGKALAMQARTVAETSLAAGGDAQRTKSAPVHPEPIEEKSWGRRFLDFMNQ